MLDSGISFPSESSASFAGANNGLSIDPVSGFVVLGDDVGGILSTLLSSRDIPMANFDINLVDAGFSNMSINSFKLRAQSLTNPNLSITVEALAAPGISLTTDNPAFPANIIFSTIGGANSYHIIDNSLTTGDFVIGNAGVPGNETKILINDLNEQVSILQTGNKGLDIIFSTGEYKLGDINNTVNGSKIIISDSSQQFEMSSLSGTWLFADLVLGLYRFGSFTFGNGTYIEVNDFLGQTINVNATGGITIIGDPTLLHTGTTLTDGAGGATGTLTNAPTAGNPTKWIAIDDNGVTRYIPTWL